MQKGGFTLLELLLSVAIVAVLCAALVVGGMKVYESSSLAVTANTIRQLSAGGMSYLADHNYVYWPYRNTDIATGDVTWWWGYETKASRYAAEGTRDFDAQRGPLAGYVPKSIRPDPSFAIFGSTLKPKYRNGYIGIGYNVEVGGGDSEQYRSANPATAANYKLRNQATLLDGSPIVIFATSAQVNTFQPPASAKNPMIEEYYALDRQYTTVHFRHHGKAMVSFANGSAGFLPMDETTRDPILPRANIGRFAPKGSSLYLLPAANP